MSIFEAETNSNQGAGEALRGTLNSTVDKRFSKPDAPVHSKNQAAIDRGRAEIESRRLAHAKHGPPQAADKQNPAYFPGAVPQSASGEDNNRQNITYGPGASGSGPYNLRPGFSGISGSQIEPERNTGGGRLGGFMKKMKEGPMKDQKGSNADGNLRIVNG
jgi:hypothetical protein